VTLKQKEKTLKQKEKKSVRLQLDLTNLPDQLDRFRRALFGHHARAAAPGGRPRPGRILIGRRPGRLSQQMSSLVDEHS
jgi:hypothetical protein